MVQVNPTASPPVLLLLHGMFGQSDNWRACTTRLARYWKVMAPDLPVLDLPLGDTGVRSLVDHVETLLDRESIDRAVIVGNSLGGHIALSLALRHPSRVAALVLAGSSGLFKRGFEAVVPRRPSREWVRLKIREVFFDDQHASPRLVDEVYGTVTDIRRVRKIVRMAKSAKHENLGDNLHRVGCPVLLVWGREDVITPPAIAHEFKRYIPQAELHFIPRCGHAPNVEQPHELSQIIERFLEQNFHHAYLGTPAVPRS